MNKVIKRHRDEQDHNLCSSLIIIMEM